MLNKVTLIGNLGRDPEIKRRQNGQTVAILRVATSRRWNDRETGERKEETEWHDVQVWGAQGESCAALTKGRQVYIEGRLKNDKWKNDQGEDRCRVKIIAEVVKFLGSARASASETEQGQAQTEDVHF